MNEEFADAWTGFLTDVDAASKALLSEARATFADIDALVAEAEERCGTAAAWRIDPLRADSLGSLYGDSATRLVEDIVGRHRKQRLDSRLTRGFADFGSHLEEAVGKLPVRAEVLPRALIDSLDDSTGMSWWVELLRLRNRERTVLVRAAALDGLSAVRDHLARTEGQVYLLEAQIALERLDGWQLVHGYSLLELRDEAGDDEAARFDKDRNAWIAQVSRRRESVDAVLGELEEQLSRIGGELSQAVIRGPRPSDHRRQLLRRREYESYWSRQRAAVRSLTDTEIALIGLGRRATALVRDVIDDVGSEYESVIGELDTAITRLGAWAPGQPDPVPHATARLVARSERLRRWRNGIERDAQGGLGDRVEALEPTRPLPGFRKPWRILEPCRLFLDAVGSAAELANEGFQVVETSHTRILRELDRVREVVAYSLATQDEATEGTQIAVEGVANALALLKHQRETSGDVTPRVETAVVGASAAAFYQFLVAYERGRLSLASHVAREGASRASRRLAVLLGEQGRDAGRTSWSAVRRAYHWVLVRIGWIAPSGESRKPVETWSYFGEHVASANEVHLPLIYDRLFRPEPVEDRRFLVGREDEIQALQEAREAWKAGRFSAVVVDGERGSGKTSLLNCAVTAAFGAESVVRLSIGDRLLSAGAVHEFLAGGLGVTVEDVPSSLRSEKRIIIIEEAERTYLRKIDGFRAIRELLSLVADTTGRNLWVLSLTREGCRFLDAALQLSSGFSHRLHASAVTADELKDAVLQRHNLSGLRLEFASPPGKSRIQEWLRQQTARVQSSEDSFFDTLHEVSGGVFRSAFTTWRRYIDRVDGGVLHMRSLALPDLSRLTQALSLEDLFFLQMLLQHGSLTAEEAASIFEWPLSVSEARIDHLLGRGILEPEPVVPGYRVQPEAGILVRAALNARNLV